MGMKDQLTKEQFLARCSLAYDAGFASPEHLALLEKWLDFVLRFEGGQMEYVVDFLSSERRRLTFGKLASDPIAYNLNQLAAILNHHCQACATDPNAWWTRSGFCPHREKGAPA